jgi:hypothetical protein
LPNNTLKRKNDGKRICVAREKEYVIRRSIIYLWVSLLKIVPWVIYHLPCVIVGRAYG